MRNRLALKTLPGLLLLGCAVLLAQPVYIWGHVGVSTIVDKIVLNQQVPERIPMELVRVTKETLPQWAKQLKDWGFTDVPDKYLQQGAAAK